MIIKHYTLFALIFTLIVTNIHSQEEHKELSHAIQNVPHVHALQENYVNDFYAIEVQYDKKGIIILLKIVAATAQQVSLIEQYEYDLLKQKQDFENNLQSITSLYNQIIEKINICEQQIEQLSTFEKLIKEKKIKKEIAQLIKNQEELYSQFMTTTKSIAQIDFALEMKNASTFKLQSYAPFSNKPSIRYIKVTPIRLEIKNLKEHYLFKWFMYNIGKELTLSLKEQEEYKVAKKTLSNAVLMLYEKAGFYLQRARELCLEESFELEKIYTELTYMQLKFS